MIKYTVFARQHDMGNPRRITSAQTQKTGLHTVSGLIKKSVKFAPISPQFRVKSPS